MEFGVLSEPGKNWVLIWSALGCVVLLGLTIVYMTGTYQRWEQRAGLFGKTRTGDVCNEAVLAGILAACLFIAIWPLLGVGLYADHERECLEPEFASEGAYELGPRTTFITYTTEGVGSGAVAQRPKDIEIYLLGRAEVSHRPDQKIERCVKVPFDKATNAYQFDTFRGEKGDRFSVPIPTQTITKTPDGWWNFSANVEVK